MLELFLKMIGIPSDLAEHTGQVQLLWARPVLLVIGLVLTPAVGYLVHRRHRVSLSHGSPHLRAVLTGCRIGLLGLLVVILGGPRLRLHQPVTHKPIVAVLADTSGSMDLPVGEYPPDQLPRIAVAAGLADPAEDGEAVDVTPELRKTLTNMTRAELARRVLATQRPNLLDPLEKRFEVRLYRFARETRRIAVRGGTGDEADEEEDAKPVIDDAGASQDTALGAAIEHIVGDAAGRQIAAVLLISDGRSTTGRDPLEVVRRHMARSPEQRPMPIWVAPVGSAVPMTDVGVLDVLAPRQLAAGDSAAVVATIGSHGYNQRTVNVRLVDGDRTLDEQQLNLEAGERQQVHLTFEADDPGIHHLAVTVGGDLAEEQVRDNNRHDLIIGVDEQKWKVLYLEGYPRWDFRFLDHALRRDHGLETTIVVEASLRAKGVQPHELPEAANLPEDADRWGEYNVVMLGDVSAELLDRRATEQLARAIRKDGLGLIVQAGMQHMPHDWAGSEVANLLPLTMAEQHNEDDDGPGLASPVYAPFAMRVTAAGSMHPAFHLYDSASKNRATWSRMPPLFWAGAFDEARPGATVLAELDTAGGDRPLIADHLVGRGRVMLIGFDATYSWRRNVGEHLFNRFWGQAIRHVARNRDRSGATSWMDVYPARIEPGETATIELFAVDAEGQPLRDRKLTAEVRQGDTVETVTLDRAGDSGRYRGLWQAGRTGAHQVAYTDATGETLSASLQVAVTGREMIQPDIDRDTLGNLADASGGAMLELHELAQLPDRLEGEAEIVYRAREADLWDNWLTLVLLVVLYCTDVAVRRMSGLT